MFVARVRSVVPRFFHKSNVLDVSADRHDNTLDKYFSKCQWTLLDVMHESLDIAAQNDSPSCDVVIACDAFGDGHAQTRLERMLHCTRPGGLLIITEPTPDLVLPYALSQIIPAAALWDVFHWEHSKRRDYWQFYGITRRA
jgi:SAM-dependent methyltransferase